jgi:hypothetical protein
MCAPDSNFWESLGSEAVTAIKSIFRNPSDRYGIVNEALLVVGLKQFAEKGNNEAATFLHWLAQGKIAVGGPYAQQAFNLASTFAKEHPMEFASDATKKIKPIHDYKKDEQVIFTMDTYLPSPDLGMGYLEHINVGTEAIVVGSGSTSKDNVRVFIAGVGEKNVRDVRIASLEDGTGEQFRYLGDDWIPCRYDPNQYGWIHLGEMCFEHRFLLKDGSVVKGKIRNPLFQRHGNLNIEGRTIKQDEIETLWYRRPSRDRVYRVPE